MLLAEIIQKYYLLYAMFGTVVILVALLIKSNRFHEKPKEHLHAMGRFFLDVYKAVPPYARVPIVIIVFVLGVGLFITNNSGNVQTNTVPVFPLTPTSAPVPQTSALHPEPAASQSEISPSVPSPEPTADHVSAPDEMSFSEESKPQKAYDRQRTIRLTLKAGYAFYEDKLYDKAIEMFERVLSIDPNNSEALSGLEKIRNEMANRSSSGSKEAKTEEKSEMAKSSKQSKVQEVPEANIGRILVTSEPLAALIFLNGVYKARTPAEMNLTTGDYTIVLVKDDYETVSVPVFIREGINMPLSVRLTPK